ncbi:MAG TPA: HNH endonuclease signature motif containing protein [Bryobacteraceae bacterium]|jgi:hypothetical protein|nr:HNH endonuclease signature motif containing protein [Bryobacteraceae bacterium]
MSAQSNGDDYEDLIHRLLNCLGISEASFEEAIAWSLCEHVVTFLAEDKDVILKMASAKDFLVQFADHVRSRTGRKWSFEDLEAVKGRLFMHFEQPHARQPIRYEDWLRLLFTKPLRCAKCHAAPPEVKLEIDHVFPSSRGGSSTASNLQFLCQKHNREKSARLQGGKPWLKLK